MTDTTGIGDTKLTLNIGHGGPAFPGGGSTVLTGMTLRDWFAGQAIAGVLASDIHYESADWDGCADYAYELADAMLKARIEYDPAEDTINK